MDNTWYFNIEVIIKLLVFWMKEYILSSHNCPRILKWKQFFEFYSWVEWMYKKKTYPLNFSLMHKKQVPFSSKIKTLILTITFLFGTPNFRIFRRWKVNEKILLYLQPFIDSHLYINEFIHDILFFQIAKWFNDETVDVYIYSTTFISEKKLQSKKKTHRN